MVVLERANNNSREAGVKIPEDLDIRESFQLEGGSIPCHMSKCPEPHIA